MGLQAVLRVQDLAACWALQKRNQHSSTGLELSIESGAEVSAGPHITAFSQPFQGASIQPDSHSR